MVTHRKQESNLEKMLKIANELLENRVEPTSAINRASEKVFGETSKYGQLLLKMNYIKIDNAAKVRCFEKTVKNIPPPIKATAQYISRTLCSDKSLQARFRAKDIADDFCTTGAIGQGMRYLQENNLVAELKNEANSLGMNYSVTNLNGLSQIASGKFPVAAT